MRRGNIDTSVNVFFKDLIHEEHGTLKPNKDLEEIFKSKGVDIPMPEDLGAQTLHAVSTCGSGMTACIIDLGLRSIGIDKIAVYDGSWSEYVPNLKMIVCIGHVS